MLSRGHAGHHDETVVFDERVFCGEGLDASKLVDEAEAKRVYLPIAIVTEYQRHLIVAEGRRLDGLPVQDEEGQVGWTRGLGVRLKTSPCWRGLIRQST